MEDYKENLSKVLCFITVKQTLLVETIPLMFLEVPADF